MCGCARPDPAARSVRAGLLRRGGFEDDYSDSDAPGANNPRWTAQPMDAAFAEVERLERGGGRSDLD